MDVQKGRETAQGAMMPGSLEPDMVSMDEAVGIPMPEKSPEQKELLSPFQESMKRLRKDKRAIFGVCMILFFVLLAIVGPPIYQHIGSPYFSDIDQATYSPQVYHT